MSTEKFANNAQTTLVGDIDASATSITVAAGSGFPASEQFRIRIDNELLLVTTGGSGSTTWTVTRGVEGTTATSHCGGALVTHGLTAGAIQNLDASVITTGTVDTARLGSGAAGSMTFLSGDQSWKPAVTSVALTVPTAEFSVSGSPVTTSGTLAIAKANQSANTVWAGPTSGGAAVPTFRALVTADYPNDSVTYAKIQNVSATSRILGRKTSGAGDPEECTLSEVLDFVGSPAQGDLLARGSSSWARVPVGTNDRPLVADSGASNGVSYKVLPIAGGGTNSGAGLNNNRLMVSASGAIVEGPALTNGQLLIGSTGGAPTASTISGGVLIVVTNSAGSITIHKGNAPSSDSGTTTNSFYTVFNGPFSNTAGVCISFSIKNTHGSNGLTLRIEYENVYEDEDAIDVNIAAGDNFVLNPLETIPGITDPPPYSELTFKVKSQVDDNHADFSARLVVF